MADMPAAMHIIAGQEMGSKAQHVEYAATGKGPEDHILLIGDAPGRFLDGRFLDGTFAGDYQQALVAEFESHLPDEVPWKTVSGNKKLQMPKVKS